MSAKASLILLCYALFGSGCIAMEAPTNSTGYLREHIYDTTVHADEALVDVNVAFNRWPDCTTLESAIRDIFRLEGVQNKSDQDKALALWKWFRILVSATGGGYAYEIDNPRRPCTDPHKILTVYGHHQCDGQSWAMVPLWRAAGYIAFDQCHWGHTIASLRYKDRDGKYRFHDFDPQGRFYWWDAKNRWVGTWTNPIMRVKVHRHIMQPQHIHSLRTSLRIGETIERKWTNEGHVVPSGRDKLKALQSRYYAWKPGKTDGVYAAVGEEVQTLSADDRNLYSGSQNTACINGVLHPKKPGQMGVFIYRMPPPYVVADAKIEATLTKGNAGDVCRLSISTDGHQWRPVFEKKTIGEEKIDVNIGLEAWKKKLPNVYTSYTFYVKAELRAPKDTRSVGVKGLKITAIRMLNKRTLPHLRPGKNYVRMTFERATDKQWVELTIKYRVKGELHTVKRVITRSPYYFKIDVPNVQERVLKNYDRYWNDGDLKMVSLAITTVERADIRDLKPSLNALEVADAFATASPHPADMTRRRVCKKPETDVRQTNGFFPQADPGRLDDDAKMHEMIKVLKGGVADPRPGKQWLTAEELGDYPKAVDGLLAALPKANIDLTLFICKALARNPHKKMIRPLLKKWKNAPKGSPGTRYIPDVLAAIGDRSVVPQLVRPLKRCRFDYRFHIAHALGILGGPQAEKTLKDLAKNDPFPAVREEAERALKKLQERE